MSASILDLVPALILVPNPSERLGHRKYTLPSPKPVRLAPSPASHAVRRNERRLTRGFLAPGRGAAGRTPVVIAIATPVPSRRLELEEQAGLVRVRDRRAGVLPRPDPVEPGAAEERAVQHQ